MPQKRQPSPPKEPSPPPSSSSTSEDEEEEEENQNTHLSAPISSQPSKKPISKNPPSDSSTEEDEDDEEEEEEEDSEDERAKAPKTQPKPVQARKEKEDDEEEEESDESGSDSSSDSDSPPPKAKSTRPARGVDPSVKPISSKPMDGAPKPKKGAVAASLSPAPKPSPQKRSAPDSSEKESKKRQKQDLGEEDEEASAKKPLFQRIWSEENEISILKAMIEFMKRGSDVSSDLTGFHDFVQKSLDVDMTKSQVSEKIRRMKRKYQNNAEKAMKGKEPSFSKEHDNLVYQLSKKIWGNEGEGENLVAEKKSRANSKKSKKTEVDTVEPKSLAPKSLEFNENRANHIHEGHGLKDMEVLYPNLYSSLHSIGLGGLGLTENEVKGALMLMGHSRAKEWDERWRKLRLKEMEIYTERARVVSELLKEYYELHKSPEAE